MHDKASTRRICKKDDKSFFYLARMTQISSCNEMWFACVTGFTMQPFEIPNWLMPEFGGGHKSSSLPRVGDRLQVGVARDDDQDSRTDVALVPEERSGNAGAAG